MAAQVNPSLSACHHVTRCSVQDASCQVNAIDFHRKQDLLVSSCASGSIVFYNTYEGKKLTTINCTRTGAALVTFTHHSKCVMHASTKVRTPRPLLQTRDPEVAASVEGLSMSPKATCSTDHPNASSPPQFLAAYPKNRINTAGVQGSEADPLEAHALRYLSIHDNRYLRYFKGHEQRVLSLSMSPKSDQFMSTGAVRYHATWELEMRPFYLPDLISWSPSRHAPCRV